MVPQGGAVSDRNGGTELLMGGMLDYYVPQAGAAATRLDSATSEFVDTLRKGDKNLRSGPSDRTSIGGQPALVTRLTTKTSAQGDPDQVIYLHTVAREAGLWYLVLAAPPSRLPELDPVFKRMVATVQFPN
jgi:hypothetical protein